MMIKTAVAAALGCAMALPCLAESPQIVLEEVIVTAQKRVQNLQETPLAISVVGKPVIEKMGIYGLDDLASGIVSSLKEAPFANTPSTLNITIRGNGPTDVAPITRDAGTAIYWDDVYLARAQGITMELADLERVEILRGPQGTLFGRNTSSGAVRLISRAPSGEFRLQQKIGVGNYDFRRSVTRVDLPRWGGVSAKFDFIHTARDGWVENRAPNQDDYNAFEKDGGRVAIRWQPSERLRVDYGYDKSRIEATQNYFQLYFDRIGMIGAEPDRASKTRYSVIQLDPTITKQDGHALSLTWERENITFKSISAYRELEEDTRNNFGGALYNNGYIAAVDVSQDQFTQELQLVGQSEGLDWVFGAFYLRERANEIFQNLYSLDQFGTATGVPLAPLIPPTSVNPLTGVADPARFISSDLESTAVYGQLTYNPKILSARLFLTFGGRYTQDEKEGDRTIGTDRGFFDLDTDYFDTSITVEYRWADDFSTYIKRATGHQAGGVNPRSASFRAYDENEVISWELGFKSEMLDNRLRINAAVFSGDYKDMPIEYSTADISITETINASRDVEVEGVELEATFSPVDKLILGVSYTYLDGDMPLQPNPLMGNELQEFALTQTPRHSGSIYVDYTFPATSIGTFSANVNVTSTSPYAYAQTDLVRRDSYSLVGASVKWTDIPLANEALSIRVWGKNLGDEEYIVAGFPVGPVAFTNAFGEPRTYGVELLLDLR